jgi:sterol desaturase/sphingolipid hydroxylase (fatty acid hydroxylase superfamily)
MTAMNVIGHLGFEVLWRGFASNRIFKWHNTSVHHNQHHQRVHCNYGLYFNLWDRLMGTNHPTYEAEYRRVTERPASARWSVAAARWMVSPSGTHYIKSLVTCSGLMVIP